MSSRARQPIPVSRRPCASFRLRKDRLLPQTKCSATLTRFEPWLQKMRNEILTLAKDILVASQGPTILAHSDRDTDDDDAALGQALSPSETISQMQRCGAQLATMIKLLHEEVLPRLPQDPEALFLSASALFVSRDVSGALRSLRMSLMSKQRIGSAELSKRHYFLSTCALRLVSEGALQLTPHGGERPSFKPVSDSRRTELIDLAEKHLIEAAHLADPDFISPFVDLDYVAKLKHPSNLAAHAVHARNITKQVLSKTTNYWHDSLQRPPHFLPSLRSQPFYDASEFEWATTLLRSFDEIRQEVLALSTRPVGAGASIWDCVGSKHDSGDAELSQGGDWKEVVLLHSDDAMAASIARNRKRCPMTAKMLSSIAAIADMADMGIGECTFSALGPGAHLQPHCGSTNTRLTCHLPLLVPDGCEIRVGEERRTYREGELIFFDDSFEHEVWNRHHTDRRIVLLIRFWHPDISSAMYRRTMKQMRKAVRRHRQAASIPPL